MHQYKEQIWLQKRSQAEAENKCHSVSKVTSYQFVLTRLMPYGDSTELNFFPQSKEITFAENYHNTNLPLPSNSQRCSRSAHNLACTSTWAFLLKCGKKCTIPSQEKLLSDKWHWIFFCFLCLPASPAYEESFWLSGPPCLPKHLPHQFGQTAHSLSQCTIADSARSTGPWNSL